MAKTSSGNSSDVQKKKTLLLVMSIFYGAPKKLPPPKKQKITDKSRWPVIQHLEKIKNLAEHLGYSLNALVTVRRQADFLGSFYAQCANRHTEPPTQEHFENALMSVLEDDSLTGKRFLDYDGLHELLSTILGRESVGFLPLEAIGSPEFSKELELFTGAKAKGEKNNNIHLNKKSCGENTWNIRRPINLGSKNLAVRATDRPLKKLTGKTVSGAIRKIEKRASKTYEVFLPGWLRSEIDIQYKSNNSRLEQKTGWDLACLGYPTHDNQNTNSP